jgi:phage shock protein A
MDLEDRVDLLERYVSDLEEELEKLRKQVE